METVPAKSNIENQNEENKNSNNASIVGYL